MALSPFGDDEVSTDPALQSVSVSTFGDDAVGRKPTLGQRVGDMFTGKLRETPEMERTPELLESGLLSGESKVKSVLIATALATTTNPDEMAAIVKKQFPHIQVQMNKDAQGNFYPVLYNPKNGAAAMVNKPGWTKTDTAQALGIGSLYLNAVPARATRSALTVGKKAVAAGFETAAKTLGIGGAIEAGQAVTGGEFNPMTPVVDALLTGPLEAVPVLLRGRASRLRDEAQTLARDAEAARADEIIQPLSAQSQSEALNTTTQQVAEAARDSADGQRLRQVAGDVQPDPDVLAAAREFDLADELLPAHFSQNPSYIEMEMGLSVIPGSKLNRQHKELVIKVAAKADELIAEYGGTTDTLGLSYATRDNLLGTVKDLKTQASGLYDRLRDIHKSSPVDVSGVQSVLDEKALGLGGAHKLTGPAKHIYNNIAEGATYGWIDQERKRIGAAIQKKSSSAHYTNAEQGELKHLYKVLTEAQEKFLEPMDDSLAIWNAAKDLTSKQKQLEKNNVVLMGKDLAEAILPKVGRALTQLAKGEYAGFKRIMDILPEDQRQHIVLSAMNDVFTTGSRKEKQLHMPGFVDWYETIKRSPDAMRMMHDYLPPGAMDRVTTLATLSKAVRNAASSRKETGVIQGLLEQFEPKNLAKVYGAPVAKTAVGEVVGTMSGLPGVATTVSALTGVLSRNADEPIVEAADSMLASPQFQKAAREYVRASGAANAATGAAERALERSQSYQRWLSRLPPETAASVSRLGMLAWLRSDADTTD